MTHRSNPYEGNHQCYLELPNLLLNLYRTTWVLEDAYLYHTVEYDEKHHAQMANQIVSGAHPHTHEKSLNLEWYNRVWQNWTNTLSTTDWMNINLPKTSNWSRPIGLEQWLKWYHLNLPMLIPWTTSQFNPTSYAWPLNSFSNSIDLGVDILQKCHNQDERGYQL